MEKSEARNLVKEPNQCDLNWILLLPNTTSNASPLIKYFVSLGMPNPDEFKNDAHNRHNWYSRMPPASREGAKRGVFIDR